MVLTKYIMFNGTSSDQSSAYDTSARQGFSKVSRSWAVNVWSSYSLTDDCWGTYVDAVNFLVFHTRTVESSDDDTIFPTSKAHQSTEVASPSWPFRTIGPLSGWSTCITATGTHCHRSSHLKYESHQD